MKKTLISIVLIVSLLSTALFSVVFAGYSVSDSKTAYAVVSAYGITVLIENTTTTENMKMMPGGSGKLADVNASGTANVASRATYSLAVDTTTFTEADWKVDDVFYCPIVISIKQGETVKATFDCNGKTYEQVKTGIAGLTYTADIALNSDLDNTDASTYDVTVNWAWSDGTTAEKDNKLTANAELGIIVNATIAQVIS